MKRWIQHPVTLKLIPAEEYIPPSENRSAMVMPDIQPYRSVIDGSMINSRSKHRAHLRQHGCIEVGNEKQTPKPLTMPGGLKEEIRAAYEKCR